MWELEVYMPILIFSGMCFSYGFPKKIFLMFTILWWSMDLSPSLYCITLDLNQSFRVTTSLFHEENTGHLKFCRLVVSFHVSVSLFWFSKFQVWFWCSLTHLFLSCRSIFFCINRFQILMWCISNLHTWVLHNHLKNTKHTYIVTNMHSYIRTFILYTCIIAYIHHCLFAFLIFCLILLLTYLLLYLPFHSYFFPCLLSWCPASLLTSLIHCFTSLLALLICCLFVPCVLLSFLVCFLFLASLCFVFVPTWMCFCVPGCLYIFFCDSLQASSFFPSLIFVSVVLWKLIADIHW